MVTSKAKHAGHGHQQVFGVLNDFLHHFQQWCNQPKAPLAAELEKFLAHNFHLSSNNKTLCKSLTDYVQRIHHLRKEYAHFEVIGPLAEPLVCEDNKIVINYELALRTHQGQKRRFCIMAIASYVDNKFVSWQQVTHNYDAEHTNLINE